MLNAAIFIKKSLTCRETIIIILLFIILGLVWALVFSPEGGLAFNLYRVVFLPILAGIVILVTGSSFWEAFWKKKSFHKLIILTTLSYILVMSVMKLGKLYTYNLGINNNIE